MILEDLNKLKQAILAIEAKTEKLPAHEQLKLQFNAIRNSINEIGSLVQKQAQDKDVLTKIKLELLKKMETDSLYYGLTQTELDKIANITIESSDKNFLNNAEFAIYLEQKLKKMPEKQLIELGYDKNYIIKIGKEISNSTSEIEQYDRGVEALTGVARTPSGLDETIDSAVGRIQKNNRLRLNLVKNYYGI